MKNIQVTKTGLVIVNKNNNVEVYTLKEYTDMKHYKKLYNNIYKAIVFLAVIFIPSYLLHLINNW